MYLEKDGVADGLYAELFAEQLNKLGEYVLSKM